MTAGASSRRNVALPQDDGEVTKMNPLIAGYVRRLKAAGRAPETTIRDRRTLLQRLDRELPCGLDEIGTADLEQWLAPFAGWTLYTYAETIRDFCRWAAADSGEPDPAADLARIRQPDDEPRPATEAEVGQALAELAGVPLVAVTIAAFNGLRCAEICALNRDHVTERTVWVQRKGSKTQLLPNHEVVWPLVAGLPPGPVVRTRRGKRFSPDHLSTRVSNALDRIGLPHLTLHRFRARYATAMSAAGKPAAVIQDLMGHANANTTARYIKVTNGQRFDAISALPVPASLEEAA